MEGERAILLDMIQWTFTDDGHGDGRLDVGKFDQFATGTGVSSPAPSLGTVPSIFLAGRAETTALVNEVYDGVAAESQMYRSWGASIIGMPAVPEAKLAREAEIAYAMLATATDYNVWHESEADVTADAVLQTLLRNVDTAKQIVSDLVRDLPEGWESTAKGALAKDRKSVV